MTVEISAGFLVWAREIGTRLTVNRIAVMIDFFISMSVDRISARMTVEPLRRNPAAPPAWLCERALLALVNLPAGGIDEHGIAALLGIAPGHQPHRPAKLVRPAQHQRKLLARILFEPRRRILRCRLVGSIGVNAEHGKIERHR